MCLNGVRTGASGPGVRWQIIRLKEMVTEVSRTAAEIATTNLDRLSVSAASGPVLPFLGRKVVVAF